MSEAARSAPAISAHRGGGETEPSGTYEAYRSALAAGAEYVEFDVRRTLDGTLVAFHRARLGWGRAVAAVSYAKLCDLAGYEVPRMAELMQLLAGRAVGHVDLKETSCADVIVRHAVEALGPAGVIVTTGEDAVAAVLKRRFPAVPVGLTIGGDVAETAAFTVRRLRARGLSRLDRVRGQPGGRGRGAPPAGTNRRSGGMPATRDQDDGLDRERRPGSDGVAGQPKRRCPGYRPSCPRDRAAPSARWARPRSAVQAGHICPQAEVSGNAGVRNPAVTWE